LIFKGIEDGRVIREFTAKNNNYPTDLDYTTQENAWTYERVMLDYIDKILRPFVDSRHDDKFCLLPDSMSAHGTDKVREAV